jgi:long-chain acyl-CoA synthetase
MFRMLTETPSAKPPDGSSLRLVISAGSALPLAVASGFRARFGIGIHQSYGTTETGPAALGDPRFNSNEGGCIGKPYAGVHFEFHPLAQDDSHRSPSPQERSSLAIAVRSPANAVGYLNDPEVSATVFRSGAVFTGDVGYRNLEGDIFVLGRDRPMLNVAGKKVAPAEVEACLRTHPCVADVAIIGIPAPGGDQKIKAVIVKNGPVTDLEIRQFCAERLADFKIPREISFEENLSRGPMGKTKLT